mgnify:CR=1 FL=1
MWRRSAQRQRSRRRARGVRRSGRPLGAEPPAHSQSPGAAGTARPCALCLRTGLGRGPQCAPTTTRHHGDPPWCWHAQAAARAPRSGVIIRHRITHIVDCSKGLLPGRTMELKWVSGTSTPWYRTSRPLRGMVPDPPLGLAPHSVQRADPSPLGYPLITESRYKFSARTRKQVRRPHFSAPAPSASAAAASTGAAAAAASPTVLACNRSSSRRCRPSFGLCCRLAT